MSGQYSSAFAPAARSCASSNVTSRPSACDSVCSRSSSPLAQAGGEDVTGCSSLPAHLAALYGELARLTGSSVVQLNQAAAIAEAGEVEAALALVERLELDRYHYLHATRAELLRRLDRVEDARAAYARALELAHSDAERRFLEGRLAELQG
jgi:hypothetical protein